jgi:hypothetical protein
MIFQFTDQRKNHEANILVNENKASRWWIPLIQIRKFISFYLLRGRREDWGELTVLAVRVFLSNKLWKEHGDV